MLHRVFPKLLGLVMLILWLGLTGCGRSTANELSQVHIVSGQTASAFVLQSTVALTQKNDPALGVRNLSNAKTFCSGTLIGRDLVLTSAHCVIGKSTDRVAVKLSNGVSLPVIDFQTYKSEQKYGVNFDVAWVKFEGELPEGFAPVPLLRNAQDLNGGVTLAGYGQTATHCAPTQSSCEPGNLFEAKSLIAEYLNRGRWFHLILIRPTPEESRGAPCLGDSGGPLFIEVRGTRYVAGNFVGWDQRLVPEQAETLCDSGQAIYNWSGAYRDWIKKTSGSTLVGESDLSIFEEPEGEPERDSALATFQDWCMSRNEGDPAWYTMERLLGLAGDYALEHDLDKRRVFEDCPYAESLLRRKIKADKGLDLNAFAPQIFGDKAQLTDLEPLRSLADFEMEHLSLNGHAIRDFGPLDDLRKLTKLEITANSAIVTRAFSLTTHPQLETLVLRQAMGALAYSTLDAAKGLRDLSIEGDLLSGSVKWSALALRSLNLRDVTASTAAFSTLALDIPKLQYLSILAPLRITLPDEMPQLQILDLKGLSLVSLPTNLSRLRNLSIEASHFDNRSLAVSFDELPVIETFRFVGNQGIESLTLPPKLQRLRSVIVTGNDLRSITSFINMPKLSLVDLSSNSLSALPLIQDVEHLTKLDLHDNLLADTAGLAGLNSLIELDLSDNPIEDLSALNGLLKLQKLKLQHLSDGSMQSLLGLASLPQLRELRVARNSFRGVTEFFSFSKLEVLVISDNAIADIAKLVKLEELTYLEVVNNPLKEEVCPLRVEKYCRFAWTE